MAIAQSLAQAPHWPAYAYLTAVDPEAQPPRIALIAERATAVVGFTIASLIPPQAELESIAVAQFAQQIGVGRKLFMALSAELKMSDVTEVMLEVRSSNQPARTFYKQLGFVEIGRRALYYADPIEDALQMRLSLI
jgi:ribosomal-protein-alanine N-acetyltransferase